MKDRRTIVRASMLVAALVAAMLLLFGIHIVMASTAPPVELAPDLPAAPSGVDEWSSGWVTISIPAGAPPEVCQTFDHSLGHYPEEYAVELWFWDLDGGWGRNRRYYGGVEDSGSWYGAWWQELTANTIRVCRGRDDDAADQIRIRVFLPRGEPEYLYESEWEDMPEDSTRTFTHGLGITETELSVSLWFSGTDRGIHHFGYGGLAVDGPERMLGGHWYGLTTNTVQVRRHPHDADIEQARVIVVHPTPPHYDSGWQNIAMDTVRVFSHNVDWNPDMLLVRAECYTSTAGIHQWLAGGSVKGWGVPPRTGSKGANIQGLTTNTVQVFRWPDDDVCPRVRVRIWKRMRQIYLPLVMLSS